MRNIRAKNGRGFTLVELMIVVAVIGILASVAYPSYVEQTQKTRRTDAQGFLMDAVNRQEQYLLDHNAYTNNMTLLGYGANPAVSPESFYTVSAATAGCGTAPCYLLTATPVPGGPQASDLKCTTLTLDSQGVKGATGSMPTKCW